MRHFIRQTRGKQSTKKSDSFIANVGPGSAPSALEVLVTEAGARTLTGGEQTITDTRSTGETVNIGDVVKYVNLSITILPRLVTDPVTNVSTGVLEWAFVCHREIDINPPITNVGTETLGVIATRMYKEDCVYSGCIPVGLNQPACVPISLKVPRRHCKIVQGDQWHLYAYFRTANATETATDAVRLIMAFIYKAYQ